MPKIKTHSGAKKRFKVTGHGQAPPPAGRPQVRRCVRLRADHGQPQEAPPEERHVDVAKADVKAAKKLLGR